MLEVSGGEEDAFIRVAINTGVNEGFQFKTHPNIDKNLHASENVLGLKDPNRPFPMGSPLGILKWRFQTTDESKVPLSINCWPSVSGGDSFVSIEYEAASAFDLHNVVIAIPPPRAARAPDREPDRRRSPVRFAQARAVLGHHADRRVEQERQHGVCRPGDGELGVFPDLSRLHVEGHAVRREGGPGDADDGRRRR